MRDLNRAVESRQTGKQAWSENSGFHSTVLRKHHILLMDVMIRQPVRFRQSKRRCFRAHHMARVAREPPLATASRRSAAGFRPEKTVIDRGPRRIRAWRASPGESAVRVPIARQGPCARHTAAANVFFRCTRFAAECPLADGCTPVCGFSSFPGRLIRSRPRCHPRNNLHRARRCCCDPRNACFRGARSS